MSFRLAKDLLVDVRANEASWLPHKFCFDLQMCPKNLVWVKQASCSIYEQTFRPSVRPLEIGFGLLLDALELVLVEVFTGHPWLPYLIGFETH